VGGEFQINARTTGIQSLPSIAVENDGDFIVTWSGVFDGYGFGIFGHRFDSAGVRLGLQFQVNTYTSYGQQRSWVASEGNGDFVVVWQSFKQDGPTNGAYGVFARRFASAGTALAAEFQVNTHTINDQEYPRVASDSDGDFIVAWQSTGQDTVNLSGGIFARAFPSSGTALATEFQVNTYTVGDQGRPAVAARADGDFVIAWNSFNQESPGSSAGNYGIFARRFTSAGLPQAVEFQVNLYTPQYQRYPNIAADNDGDFVVTWESRHQDGDYEGVFARRILGNSAFGPEFQANSYTPDGQTYPVVDFDSDGEFVIAWYSEEAQDGNSYGVFAQRFTLPPLATLDVDGNGLIAPLTDGLLALRHLFGFSGPSLVNGALGANCTRCAAAEITAYLGGLGQTLNIDGNPQLDPLTDGLLVLRYLFGFTGTTLTGGAVGNMCSRCDATTIVPYLQTLD
jgi:hypothetical protein